MLLAKARRKSKELSETVSSMEELHKSEQEGNQNIINEKDMEIRKMKETQYNNDRTLLQLLKKIEEEKEEDIDENNEQNDNIDENNEKSNEEDTNDEGINIYKYVLIFI